MKVGRDALVECAVALIDEQGGTQGVNMRAVATRAKCAHTNVYNFFESYEALLWAALGLALDRYVAYIEARIGASRAQGVEAYKVLLRSQVDFARDHTGLYRFISFEYRFSTPMPREIGQRLQTMETAILDLLGGPDCPVARRKELKNAHRIVFRYVYGSICGMVQGRLGEGMGGAEVEILRKNTDLLCRLLLDEIDSPAPRRKSSTKEP